MEIHQFLEGLDLEHPGLDQVQYVAMVQKRIPQMRDQGLVLDLLNQGHDLLFKAQEVLPGRVQGQ